MRFNFEKRHDERGRVFEARVLGTFDMSEAFLERERNLPRKKNGMYKRVDDLFALVEEEYPHDPEDPPTQIGKDLRIATADALGLAPEEEKHLKFYTAIGTPVDTRMGVDAYVLYDGGPVPMRVTIDATVNKRKVAEQSSRADVVIAELPDAVHEEDDYLKEIDEYGQLIAEYLKRGKLRKVA